MVRPLVRSVVRGLVDSVVGSEGSGVDPNALYADGTTDVLEADGTSDTLTQD